MYYTRTYNLKQTYDQSPRHHGRFLGNYFGAIVSYEYEQHRKRRMLQSTTRTRMAKGLVSAMIRTLCSVWFSLSLSEHPCLSYRTLQHRVAVERHHDRVYNVLSVTERRNTSLYTYRNHDITTLRAGEQTFLWINPITLLCARRFS